MALRDAQATFQRHVLDGVDACELLSGTPQRRELGLAIYANAYRRRLVDVLADAYERTRLLLGAEAFETLALTYVEAHTPRQRNLRWYGAGFDHHLLGALPQQPQAAEVARLDWELRRAFDGPDSAVLDAQQLSQLPAQAWAELRLVPVPTTRLVRFATNAVQVWQSLSDGQTPPPCEHSPAAVEWVVWRKQLQPHFRSLQPGEAPLLRAMLDGASFADACERAADRGADFIGERLRQWLQDELLAEVRLGDGAAALAAATT